MSIKQHLPKPSHLVKTAKQLIPAAIVGIGTFIILVLIVSGLFGFGRLYHDFIPLDASPVGPNLCASLFIVGGVLALNEYKTVRKDEEEGKSFKDILEDTVDEIAQPVTEFEEGVAEQVEQDLKEQGVTDAGTS